MQSLSIWGQSPQVMILTEFRCVKKLPSGHFHLVQLLLHHPHIPFSFHLVITWTQTFFFVTCHEWLFHSGAKQSLEISNWSLICTNQIPQPKAMCLNSITASVSQSNKLGELNRDSLLSWMPNTEWLPRFFFCLSEEKSK